MISNKELDFFAFFELRSHGMAAPNKRDLRIPQVIRYRIAGLKDAHIAQLVGLTAAGLAQLMQSQEFKDEQAAYLAGHLSKLDEALAGNIGEIRKQFKPLVPAALRALVDSVTQRADLKTALAAAKEILDRDPDRTLVAAEAQAPMIPPEVLQAAIDTSNNVAQGYVDSSKKPN